MSSPFDEVLEGVRAALEARRAGLAERLERVEHALRGYEQAVLGEIAAEFVVQHTLKRLTKQRTARDAAQALARAVAELPELAPSSAPRSEPEAEPESEPASAPPAARATSLGKIVIIGALAGREKSSALPSGTEAVEWIDTERDGVHAIGNLPQRIRQGRVRGIVILERVVQHKHTEPVVAAARDARVPVAFGGQGGRAALARALSQIDVMIRERARA